MKKGGWAKVVNLFCYSDSELNEVLIAFFHVFVLPLTLVEEFHNPSVFLIFGGISAGAFQLWSVVWNGSLKYRLIAVQIATLIAMMTVINLFMANLLYGSRLGWVIILLFAIWNTIRVFKEKLERHG